MTHFVGSRSAQLEGLIVPSSIVVLPMGALTPHGPHLPLETSILIANELGRRTGEALEGLGLRALVLPAVNFAIARLAQAFDGGITMRPGTMWALVEDLLLSLQQDGVRKIVICNAHPEFEQVRVLRHLSVDYSVQSSTDCQLLFSQGDRDFEPEFREEDAFGGQLETSLMLAVAPDLVDQELARTLAPVDIRLPDPVHGKNRCLKQLGAHAGYLGNPAGASAEEGEAFLQAWSRSFAEACRKAWPAR